MKEESDSAAGETWDAGRGEDTRGIREALRDSVVDAARKSGRVTAGGDRENEGAGNAATGFVVLTSAIECSPRDGSLAPTSSNATEVHGATKDADLVVRDGNADRPRQTSAT